MTKLVIVSGRSGSGKSTALHLLEDIGYYCVDNLPLELLDQLIATLTRSVDTTRSNNDSSAKNIAIGLDIRNHAHNFEQFPDIVKSLKERIDTHVIYLDTDDQALIQRFNATRRPHPLKHKSVNLDDALNQEQEILTPIIHSANHIIDTSQLNLYQLREKIRRSIGDSNETFSVIIESFGFKKGIPTHADFIFDARILPNPYWREDLRALSGQDAPIVAFFEAHTQVAEFVTDTLCYLQKWLPQYQKTDRAELVIGIGCTGGQHRSVYVAERLFDALSPLYKTALHHRDKH